MENGGDVGAGRTLGDWRVGAGANGYPVFGVRGSLPGRCSGGKPDQRGMVGSGTAVVVRDTGGRHSVRNATSLQVRFRNGEVFDHVQLLGVDSRREVAAIRMANPAGWPWSVSNGVVSGARVADEVPGTGRGYRLIHYTAPSSPGSSGGVLFDRKGAALALGGRAFSVPESELRGSARRRAGDGRGRIPQERYEPKGLFSTGPQASLGSSERSDPLTLAKDSTMILPSFGYDRLRLAALGRHRDFRAFHLRMVDLVQVRGGFTLFSVTRTRA